MPSTGGLFVLKLDPTGRHVWSRGYDGASVAGAPGLSLDPTGQLFVMGSGHTPGAPTSSPSATFALALAPSGDELRVNPFTPEGPGSSFTGAAIAAGPAGQLAFVGAISGRVSFGSTILTSGGSTEVATGLLRP